MSCPIWAPSPYITVGKLSPDGELEEMIFSFSGIKVLCCPWPLPENSFLIYALQLYSYLRRGVSMVPVFLSLVKAEVPTITPVLLSLFLTL